MHAKFLTLLYKLIKRDFNYPDVEWKTITKEKNYQNTLVEIYRSTFEWDLVLEVNDVKNTGFLMNNLFQMSSFYPRDHSEQVLLIYWILHSLELLNRSIERDTCIKIAQFLSLCINDDGGFGGGPGQVSNLVPTCMGVLSICMIGMHFFEAYGLIKRASLKNFIISCRNSDGSFKLSPFGETNVSAIYYAIVVSKITDIFSKDMFVDSENYLKSCQNYDGGFGLSIGLESMAIWTFHGFSSLVLLNMQDQIDQTKMLNWIAHRQMSFAGGFNSRSNELVNSADSYWCGAIFSIIETFDEGSLNKKIVNLYDKPALEIYLLIFCQSQEGGFCKRPGTLINIFQTCFSLSAYSLMQNSTFDRLQHFYSPGYKRSLLELNNPIYAISSKAYINAVDYFYKLLLLY